MCGIVHIIIIVIPNFQLYWIVTLVSFCDLTTLPFCASVANWTSTCRTACVSNFSSWMRCPSWARLLPQVREKQKKMGTWSSRYTDREIFNVTGISLKYNINVCLDPAALIFFILIMSSVLKHSRLPDMLLSCSVTPFQDEKQRFASVLLLARLLAKFLGFISFLPYQTSEKPSKEIQDSALIMRSKVRRSHPSSSLICL